jgi:TctA family transporter
MNVGTGKPSVAQMVKLVIGIIMFALLMSERSNFEQRWIRALVAGCAGGILAWAVLQCRKSRDKDSSSQDR